MDTALLSFVIVSGTRILALIVAGFFGYLGYQLFAKNRSGDQEEMTTTVGSVSITLKRFGSGAFFLILAAVIAYVAYMHEFKADDRGIVNVPVFPVHPPNVLLTR